MRHVNVPLASVSAGEIDDPIYLGFGVLAIGKQDTHELLVSLAECVLVLRDLEVGFCHLAKDRGPSMSDGVHQLVEMWEKKNLGVKLEEYIDHLDANQDLPRIMLVKNVGL